MHKASADPAYSNGEGANESCVTTVENCYTASDLGPLNPISQMYL